MIRHILTETLIISAAGTVAVAVLMILHGAWMGLPA